MGAVLFVFASDNIKTACGDSKPRQFGKRALPKATDMKLETFGWDQRDADPVEASRPPTFDVTRPFDEHAGPRRRALGSQTWAPSKPSWWNEVATNA